VVGVGNALWRLGGVEYGRYTSGRETHYSHQIRGWGAN